MNFLIEPKKGTKWPSNLPRIENRQEAIVICKELCKLQYIHRSEKAGKGELEASYIISVTTARLLLLFGFFYYVASSNVGFLDLDGIFYLAVQ